MVYITATQANEIHMNNIKFKKAQREMKVIQDICKDCDRGGKIPAYVCRLCIIEMEKNILKKGN